MQQIEKLYDIQRIYDLASGDHNFVKRLITIFVTETPETINAMFEAHKNGDNDTLKRLAHRIKPSIQNLGINSIVNDLRDLEAGTESHNNAAKLTKIAKVLIEVLVGLKEEMELVPA
ncbi:MAG: Hpt domain-containing protein [Bacteroidia bacterium]